MSKDNNAFDKAFDMLLTEAAIIADENIGKKIEMPEEEFVFSKKHEQKMSKLFRKARYKLLAKNIMKYSTRCACVFLALAVVASISIFSVSAWRIKFLNFVFESDTQNTDYSFSDDKPNSYSDEEITLGYVPEGFELTNSVDDGNIFLRFDKRDEYFTVSISDIDGQFNIDTEGADGERLKINGYDAAYISDTENTTVSILVWSDNMYGYTVYGNIDKNQVIKIAENMNID